VDAVTEAAAFEYDLRELPPGRVPFRRWRYELWHGAALLRAGWRVSLHDAECALRTAASHRAHALIGVRPLRPDRTHTRDSFRPGAIIRLDCGAVSCLLSPRRVDDQAATA
jgi:hypothetical protein